MEDGSDRNTHRYYSSGWIGGIFFLFFNFTPMVPGLQFMDWLLQIISLPMYFFIARSAAEKRYHEQQADADPLEGMRSTAMGAVMIALIFSVVTMILVEVIRSMISSYDLISPASLCWKVPSQIIIALLAGGFSSNIVEKNYKQDGN
jgi:hypothetical protein